MIKGEELALPAASASDSCGETLVVLQLQTIIVDHHQRGTGTDDSDGGRRGVGG